MPGIIVGVDGSDHSRLALGWAMREAAQHHVPLTVMTVRPVPVRPATRIFWAVPDFPEDSHDPELARKAVQEFVDKVANEIGETVPEVTVSVATGIRPKNSSRPRVTPTCSSWDPAAAGLRQAPDGSVSSQVTHHAACPVVVVPAGAR